MTEYGQAELSTSTLNGYKTYKKTKFMDTCENNQKLYQWALNIPDINIQQLPMIKYVFFKREHRLALLYLAFFTKTNEHMRHLYQSKILRIQYLIECLLTSAIYIILKD